MIYKLTQTTLLKNTGSSTSSNYMDSTCDDCRLTSVGIDGFDKNKMIRYEEWKYVVKRTCRENCQFE